MRELRSLFRQARLTLIANFWFAIFIVLGEYADYEGTSLPLARVWKPLSRRAYVKAHLSLFRAAGI